MAGVAHAQWNGGILDLFESVVLAFLESVFRVNFVYVLNAARRTGAGGVETERGTGQGEVRK